jgi:hypothetical protein
MNARGLALTAGLTASSCIITPTVPHTPFGTEHRGEVGEGDFLALAMGSTTREDVLLLLGEPDLRRDDDRIFAFVWDEAWLFFAAAGMGGGGVAGEATRHLALMVSFDESGRLARKEVLKQPQTGLDKDWYSQLEKWR